jgi:hypothetical protein
MRLYRFSSIELYMFLYKHALSVYLISREWQVFVINTFLIKAKAPICKEFVKFFFL